MVCIHYAPITILDHVNAHMTGWGTRSFKTIATVRTYIHTQTHTCHHV